MSSRVLLAQLFLSAGAAALFALIPERRAWTPLWLVLAALGLFAYTGFGRLHGDGRFVHVWDTYHYYVGAKYADELGYDGLYECTAVADAEAGLVRDTAMRTMTDLRSNRQTTTLAILADPAPCTSRFTPHRWRAFAADVAFFRGRVDRGTWQAMQRDHGYNATPAWQLVGGALARLAPATDAGIGALALLDPLLLVGAVALVAWAFGWRIAALFALLVGTYFPARFYWTGGAFLRLDWVFLSAAGICLLRKERPGWGGVALAAAALSRIFPLALLVAPALAALVELFRCGRLSPCVRSALGGAAIVLALGAGATLVTGDGGRGFIDNTLKHAATPLTNHMGLPALAGFRQQATTYALRHERKVRAAELWSTYKEERRQAQRDAAWLIWLARALVAAAMLRALRLELWRASALGLLVVPVAVSLTCYYYVFVALAAVLADGRRSVAPLLLGLAAGSQALALALGPPFLSRAAGMDELYAAQSGLSLVVLAAVALVTLATRRRA